MGGSIAKALSLKNYNVIGADLSPTVISEALRDGVIKGGWDMNSPVDADITLICLSPVAALGFLSEKAPLLSKNSVVSDICGIKREICSFAERVCGENSLYFVGGHPMAGRERSGYRNSTEKLFENRSYILTVTEATNRDALEEMKRLATDIGCSDVTVTTPELHDKMIAFTSQLPHILAGAYIKSPQSDRHSGFSAGSYHDVSRVASVDENLWKELFLLNRENILEEIDTLISHLNEYKQAIAAENENALGDCIRQGRLLKERDINKNGSEKPHNFG